MLRAFRGISEDKGDPDACAEDHGGECIPVFPVADDVVDLILNVRDDVAEEGQDVCKQLNPASQDPSTLDVSRGHKEDSLCQEWREQLEAFGDAVVPNLSIIVDLL
ncbi:hypothetical protein MHU86_14973 [Fragilaria crotonensis]|nr:hypothetical protein MHU86_14973 [Fragilaria crotonensis]